MRTGEARVMEANEDQRRHSPAVHILSIKQAPGVDVHFHIWRGESDGISVAAAVEHVARLICPSAAMPSHRVFTGHNVLLDGALAPATIVVDIASGAPSRSSPVRFSLLYICSATRSEGIKTEFTYG